MARITFIKCEDGVEVCVDDHCVGWVPDMSFVFPQCDQETENEES